MTIKQLIALCAALLLAALAAGCSPKADIPEDGGTSAATTTTTTAAVRDEEGGLDWDIGDTGVSPSGTSFTSATVTGNKQNTADSATTGSSAAATTTGSNQAGTSGKTEGDTAATTETTQPSDWFGKDEGYSPPARLP